MYKPKYIDDIESIPCGRKKIYTRSNGTKTAFLYYVDGLKQFEYSPKYWEGWKLVRLVIGEKEVA